MTDAYQFALDAHEGSRRDADTDIDHPLAAAQLLSQAGQAHPSFPELPFADEAQELVNRLAETRRER